MKIVKDYIKDKEILYCPMPMSRNLELLEHNEKIYRNPDQIPDDSSYFSIIIVKEN